MIVFTEKTEVVSLFVLKIFNQSAFLILSSKKKGFFEGFHLVINIHTKSNRWKDRKPVLFFLLEGDARGRSSGFVAEHAYILSVVHVSHFQVGCEDVFFHAEVV